MGGDYQSGAFPDNVRVGGNAHVFALRDATAGKKRISATDLHCLAWSFSQPKAYRYTAVIRSAFHHLASTHVPAICLADCITFTLMPEVAALFCDNTYADGYGDSDDAVAIWVLISNYFHYLKTFMIRISIEEMVQHLIDYFRAVDMKKLVICEKSLAFRSK